MGSVTAAVVCARIRMPLCMLAAGLLIADLLTVALGGVSFLRGGISWWLWLALVVVALALYFRLGTLRVPATSLDLPVQGRWVALNSPASRVPSHGLHAYGQTYAIDLVYDPADGSRPGFAWRPLTRPARDFPGFGRRVSAPVSGRVVRVHRNARDHRSRTSPLALLYLLIEGVREFRGPAGLLGNYVVIDRGDGVYAVLAHLQRGSVQVRPGEKVRAGDLLARCGNSGNSTEPHLHLQVMDCPLPLFAAGMPLRFASDRTSAGVPATGQALATTDD